MAPELAVIMTDRMMSITDEIGFGFDAAAVSREALEWARQYSFELVTGLNQTTERLVREAVTTFIDTPGMTRGDLVRMLEPAFGEARANMIAVTEVTRAYSAATNAQQAELIAEGMPMQRVWDTLADDLVCPICGPLDGAPEDDWKVKFPDGPPAHVNCRCGTSLTVATAEELRAEQVERQAARDAAMAERMGELPGAPKPLYSVADTLDVARDQAISQEYVLEQMIAANPPEQIARGDMTVKEWADRYMSKEPKGYALIRMHPKAGYLPIEAGNRAKVETFTALQPDKAPPIIIDSNEKIEARFGGGRLDRAFGRQPHTVIDGKHRLEAALARGDKAIDAYVPQRQLEDIWQSSHRWELEEWALGYFDDKGYPVISRTDNGFVVERMGRQKTYTVYGLEKIARKLGHEWAWSAR